MRFDDYHEAREYAERKANNTGLDVALRRVGSGYVVSFASRNDSDYATAEIVRARSMPAWERDGLCPPNHWAAGPL